MGSGLRMKWVLRPTEDQGLLRRCPNCDTKQVHRSSGAFRVNAHRKLIDIWHIYRCERCKFTWNIEIMSRINRSSIDLTLYDLFLRNDPEEIRRRVFDYPTLARNKAELAAAPNFEIAGPELSDCAGSAEATVHLVSEFLLPVRLGAVLARKLRVPRSRVADLVEAHMLRGISERELSLKVKESYELRLDVQSLLGVAGKMGTASQSSGAPKDFGRGRQQSTQS